MELVSWQVIASALFAIFITIGGAGLKRLFYTLDKLENVVNTLRIEYIKDLNEKSSKWTSEINKINQKLSQDYVSKADLKEVEEKLDKLEREIRKN